MPKQKLMVFCIDALCDIDLSTMKDLPNFGWMMENGSIVRKVEPVYPSFTYPCHVTIMTGVYPNRHGIAHNEKIEAGKTGVPWYSLRKDVRAKYLLEYAKERGFTTCAINWPLTGGADFDLNLPMIVPMMYRGSDPIKFYQGYATQELIERYGWKYERLITRNDLSLDLFTMAVAPDIIRDYGQPDVMLVKMCDLDSVRHNLGVDTEQAKRQLMHHDAELGVLMECVRRYGDFENTNFVVLGDHGQSDVDQVLNFNILLKDNGFLTVDGDGNLVDYDAFCHSVGMSGWIAFKHPEDKHMYKRMYDFLMDVKSDPGYGLGMVLTREEANEVYHLNGPFDFVIECEKPYSIGYSLTGALFAPSAPGDYKTAMGSHGGIPTRDHMTAFFACGPAVRKGVYVDRARLVDEAPTMARMLGFEMEDVDGQVIPDILK